MELVADCIFVEARHSVVQVPVGDGSIGLVGGLGRSLPQAEIF